MLRTALTILQVFTALAIVALVLIQRGKGADAGAGFGTGASGTVFGARGARTGLSRATAIFAAVFMLNSLLLVYMGNRSQAAAPSGLIDESGAAADVSTTAPAASSVPPASQAAPSAVTPVPEIPGTPPSTEPVPAPAQ